MKLAALVLFALAMPTSIHAQVAPVASSSKDAAAITAIAADLTNAWNKGDATAFSAHYASDGSFTNILASLSSAGKASLNSTA